ncbi:hypothetical protein D9615_007217 [Tricholomella constricta]|uniref:Uncharacterized protein n=1 Tax=Tricholomella constricta TaxID=117010 RepID=A0A8H5M137_9AGAR|nr:hypothetical protein D9615_007217 [Tricholomella constricta]
MADISWLAPVSGSTFSPGDRIHVKWKATRPTVSASFRLCLSSLSTSQSRRDDGACGMAIWPKVKDKGETFTASFAVPEDLKDPNTFVLRMEDVSGTTFESPIFFLTPSRLPASGEVKGAASSPGAPQTPDNMAHHSEQSPSSISPPVAAVSSSSTNPTLNSSTTSSQPGYTPKSGDATSSSSIPNILLSHNPPNTASFAVPLTIIVVMFLIGVWLAIRHHRKLMKGRLIDAEKLRLPRQSSGSTFKAPDNLGDISNGSKHAPVPIPPFMPVDLPQVPKRSHRKSVPVSSTYTNAAPVVKNAVRNSRALSTRSTYSQASVYLPPIVPAPQGLFDEERENPTAHSVIADYFQESPIISHTGTLDPPPRAHVSGGTVGSPSCRGG